MEDVEETVLTLPAGQGFVAAGFLEGSTGAFAAWATFSALAGTAWAILV
jgi:hypothetical protein